MKKWKLITIISSVLIVAAITTTLIIIFTKKPNEKKESYKYPDVIPTISNPSDVYLTLGSRGITNEEIYNTGVLSYGLNVLIDLVDEKLLSDITYTDDEFLEHKKSIYATYNDIEEDLVDLNDAEQTKKYELQMTRQGYISNEQKEKAVKLDLIRTKFAKVKYKEMVDAYVGTNEQPLFYGESQIKDAIDSLYPSTINGIYLTFRSESEAKKLMKQVGINPDSTSGGWKNLEGAKLTDSQVVDAFITMHNTLNNETIDLESIPEYKQSDINSISSTISQMLFQTLKGLDEDVDSTERYTLNPKKYITGYYYLALKTKTRNVITTSEYIEAVKNNSNDEKVKAISDKLFDMTFVSSVINAFLYENRANASIEVFDERIEYNYNQASETALKTLSDTTAKFNLTTNESDKNIATFKKGEEVLSITADELFSELVDRYGTIIAIQYMNFYLFFGSDNLVYDFENKVKGPNFEQSYKANVEYLKDELEAGNLVDIGYASTYGFDNFIRDYFGITNKDEAILMGSSYSEAINDFDEKQIRVSTEEALDIYNHMIEAYINHTLTIEEYNEYVASIDASLYENTILYQITKSFTEYFDVTATTFTAFIDMNGDGVADELTEDKETLIKEIIDAFYLIARLNPKKDSEISGTTPKDMLAKALINAVNANQYAPDSSVTGSTVHQRLKTLVKIFNNSKVDDSVFGKYKLAGIRFQLTVNNKYTDETLTGEVGKALKNVWNQILDGTLVLNSGNVSSFEYAEAVNSAVTSLNALNFNDSYYTVNEIIKEDNKLTKVIVAGATNTTWYHYTTDNQELIPSISHIEELVLYYRYSQIEEEARTKEQFEFVKRVRPPQTYENNYLINIIVPAMTKVIGDDVLQKVVYQLYKDNLGSHNFNFTTEKYNQECLDFMKAIYEE